MKIKEVLYLLKKDGWFEKMPRKGTSHRQFIHPNKKGKITVPDHKGDIPIGTLKSILRHAGIDF